MIIFLIGFMGSGKSFYADKIASMMKMPFIDLDVELERKEGVSISEIFSQKGEEEFRRIEASLLRECVASFHEKAGSANDTGDFVALIACGGGTPCFYDNMHWMNQHGLTIWINPPSDVLKQRLVLEKAKRPLIAGLSGEALEKYIDAQLSIRAQYYAKANIQITNSETSIEEIINKIKHA
jgi:shikimate kinase